MKRVIVYGCLLVAGLFLSLSAYAENKPYPLDTCIVSDQKLGSMGEPIEYVHEGQIVKFCCAGCVDVFKAEPEKYLKKIKEATKEQK